MKALTYPNPGETFTIEQFRTDNSIHTAEFYVHVVNDDTGVCSRILTHYDFEYVRGEYERLKRECKEGWHIEVTVAISTCESRARLL